MFRHEQNYPADLADYSADYTDFELLLRYLRVDQRTSAGICIGELPGVLKYGATAAKSGF